VDFSPGWTDERVRENAERIRGLRKERRISRKLLADEAGVNVSQISRAERGQDVRFSTMLKIYAGLGYLVDLQLQETCEETEDLLQRETWRRLERCYAGLEMGKRWNG
jgi:transcriptional regulator with XRE-family HTH domain